MGWRDFFILTVFAGIPGIVMLARFVPWGVREPAFAVEPPKWGAPLGRGALVRLGFLGAVTAAASCLVLLALLGAIADMRARGGFELGASLVSILSPRTFADWLSAASVAVCAVVGGLGTAATAAARRGVVTTHS
jgi:PAT family beta-lactamase induction signal transducer AmpG